MSNPQKEKGSRWERESAKLLNIAFPHTWKRIAMSGAAGTIMDIPLLKPDILGEYPHISRKFAGECKVGYGGKEMTVKKAWFDGIRKIADELYGLPVVVLKFEKSRTGVRHIICMDFEAWDSLMIEMSEMYHELLKFYEQKNGNEELN